MHENIMSFLMKATLLSSARVNVLLHDSAVLDEIIKRQDVFLDLVRTACWYMCCSGSRMHESSITCLRPPFTE
jgi:hypothetical protein